MNTLNINSIKPAGSSSAIFEGFKFAANASFFVVNSAPGKGAEKHRHPYEEIFIILDGKIEVIVDGEKQIIEGGNIAIIPPNAWHEFKNRSDHNAQMVNIHPVPKMIQKFWNENLK